MREVEIEAFLAVIDLGSISAAANSLYITQPALSRRISTLEEELGYKLFIRNKGIRNIELTPEGKSFITIAQKWKTLFLESRNLTYGLSNSYEFRMGVIGSMSTYLLPAIFQKFINEHPECNISIHQHHSEECYYYMGKGLLDLALVGKEKYSKTIATIPVIRSPFKLVSRCDKLCQCTIHPSQLDPSKEIFVPWNSRFENWHDYWFAAQNKPRVWLDMIPPVEHFIVEKDSWIIAPTYIASYLAAKLQIRVYNIAEAPPAMTVYAIYPKEFPNIYVQKFLATLKSSLSPNKDLQLFL